MSGLRSTLLQISQLNLDISVFLFSLSCLTIQQKFKCCHRDGHHRVAVVLAAGSLCSQQTDSLHREQSCAFLSSLSFLLFGTSAPLMIWLLEIQKHKEKNDISERSVGFFHRSSTTNLNVKESTQTKCPGACHCSLHVIY